MNGTKAVAPSPKSNARGTGVWMLIALLPAGFTLAVFAHGSQHGFREEQDWFLAASFPAAFLCIWLLLAGIAFVRKAPVTSLRFPGIVALIAAIAGVVVMVPRAFGNGRGSETVSFARLALPVILIALSAGIGHLNAARGKASLARVFHILAWLGVPLEIAIFVMMVYRIL